MDFIYRDHISTKVIDEKTSKVTFRLPTDHVLELIQLLEVLLNATRFVRRSTRITFFTAQQLKKAQGGGE